MNEYELYWNIFHGILGFISWSGIVYIAGSIKIVKKDTRIKHKSIDDINESFRSSVASFNRLGHSTLDAMVAMKRLSDEMETISPKPNAMFIHDSMRLPELDNEDKGIMGIGSFQGMRVIRSPHIPIDNIIVSSI